MTSQSVRMIVCGSRHARNRLQVTTALRSVVDRYAYRVVEVIVGDARGVDEIVRILAEQSHLPVKVFYADWQKLGRSAGPVRNRDMLVYCGKKVAGPSPLSVVVAMRIEGVPSPGTDDTVRRAKQMGFRVHEILLAPEVARG